MHGRQQVFKPVVCLFQQRLRHKFLRQELICLLQLSQRPVEICAKIGDLLVALRHPLLELLVAVHQLTLIPFYLQVFLRHPATQVLGQVLVVLDFTFGLGHLFLGLRHLRLEFGHLLVELKAHVIQLLHLLGGQLIFFLDLIQLLLVWVAPK